jgi:hypothetical protein
MLVLLAGRKHYALSSFIRLAKTSLLFVLGIALRSRLLRPRCSIRVLDRPKIKKQGEEQRRAKEKKANTHIQILKNASRMLV